MIRISGSKQLGIIHSVLIILTLIALFSCNGEGVYIKFRLQQDEQYTYDEGDLLLYQRSDGLADSFLVEEIRYTDNVETSPYPGFFGPDRTYDFQDCDITIRNLSGFWETDVVYDGTGTDSSRCFRIEVYGQEYGNKINICSKIRAGCDGITNYSNEPGSCLSGREGPSLSTSYREYTNVFSDVVIVQPENSEIEIHYRIHWSSKYGIIRFENLAVNPTLSWDLVGRVE